MKITVQMVQQAKLFATDSYREETTVKVVNGKGDFTINDIKRYIKSVARINISFNPENSVMHRYAEKQINPAFYGKIDVKAPSKYLTKEEFRNGKSGYVLANFKNGTIEFE